MNKAAREAFDKEHGITDRVNEERVIDQYYFHLGNSGINVSTNENYSNYTDSEKPDKDHSYKSWWLTHRLSSHGVGTNTTLPLENVEQIDIYIEMLQKVRSKMIEHYGESGRHKHGAMERASPSMLDGYHLEEVYTEEVKTKNSRSKDLLGYNLVDDEGVVRGFVENKVEGRGRYEGSCSSIDWDDDSEEEDGEKTNLTK